MHQPRAAELFQLWPFPQGSKSTSSLDISMPVRPQTIQTKTLPGKMVCSLLLSPHFIFLIPASICLALLTQSLSWHPHRYFTENLVLPTAFTSSPVDPGYSSNLLAQEKHFYSWDSFRNHTMLCTCLYDLLSPFILLQLLSQLSSFSSKLCYSLTWLSPPGLVLQCCHSVSLPTLKWCHHCQHWHINLTRNSRYSSELVRSLRVSNAHSLVFCALCSWLSSQEPLLCDSWVCDSLPARLLF